MYVFNENTAAYKKVPVGGTAADTKEKQKDFTNSGNDLTKETYETLRKSFDMEYQTMWKREMLYLKDRGIRYTFVRKTKDNNIPVYKYEKTPKLFDTLSEFFKIIEEEKAAKKKHATDCELANDTSKEINKLIDAATSKVLADAAMKGADEDA